jgi:hypothetical protein
MKRNTIQFTLFIMIMLALAVSSCKDDDTTGDGNGDGNGNGDGGGDPVLDDNYFPRETGNTWNYSDNSIVEVVEKSGEFYEVTNFGPISGVSVSIAEGLTVDKIYVKKDDGDYSVRAELQVFNIPGITDGVADPIEYIILKDDAAIGTTWSGELAYRYTYTLPLLGPQTIELPSVPYTFTVMGRAMTLEVGTKTFEDVIQIRQEFDLLTGLIGTDIYYAEGVGVIRYQTSDGLTGSTDLVEYDLN